MAASITALPAFGPLTLTDRSRDITTVKAGRTAAELTRREVIPHRPLTVRVTFREPEQQIVVFQLSAPNSALPDWFMPSLSRAVTLLTLEPNWDGEGAPRVSHAGLQSALEFLFTVMRNGTSLPQWTPTREGGVQLDWHENGVDLEMEFNPNSNDPYVVYLDSRGPEWDGFASSNPNYVCRVLSERLTP